MRGGDGDLGNGAGGTVGASLAGRATVSGAGGTIDASAGATDGSDGGRGGPGVMSGSPQGAEFRRLAEREP